MIQATTDINSIETALKAVLSFIVDGEDVLNERAPGARPLNKPYTTFMLYWTEGHGHVFRSYEDRTDQFVQKIGDDAYHICRVVAYGKDALSRCNILRMALNSEMPQVQLFRDKIGICDVDDVQAIPESDVDGSVRERAYFQFKFYAGIEYEFDVDWFDKLNLVVSVPELNYATTDLLTKGA